jgi:ABC-type sugar transport system permease subunit
MALDCKHYCLWGCDAIYLVASYVFWKKLLSPSFGTSEPTFQHMFLEVVRISVLSHKCWGVMGVMC